MIPIALLVSFLLHMVFLGFFSLTDKTADYINENAIEYSNLPINL